MGCVRIEVRSVTGRNIGAMKRVAVLAFAVGCAHQPAPPAPIIVPPPMSAQTRKTREEDLARARRMYELSPDSAEAILWLGRRTAYLGRYSEAIEIFTEGIRKHPGDARMYRHRGHRFITTRRFDDAIRDLEHAAELVRGKPDEVEPDGQPNARNIPIGSLQTNIYYHLGLAYYLKGDYERAVTAYRRCNEMSTNADRLVSTSYWLYLSLRRLGRQQEAEKVLEPIGTSMDIIENVAYHKLLLMFSGDIAPEELQAQDPNTTDGATIFYGIGAWHFVNAEPEKARPLWEKVLAGTQWASFGYIAAEAERRSSAAAKF